MAGTLPRALGAMEPLSRVPSAGYRETLLRACGGGGGTGAWRPGGQAGAKVQVGEDGQVRRPVLELELGAGQEAMEQRHLGT